MSVSCRWADSSVNGRVEPLDGFGHGVAVARSELLPVEFARGFEPSHGPGEAAVLIEGPQRAEGHMGAGWGPGHRKLPSPGWQKATTNTRDRRRRSWRRDSGTTGPLACRARQICRPRWVQQSRVTCIGDMQVEVERRSAGGRGIEQGWAVLGYEGRGVLAQADAYGSDRQHVRQIQGVSQRPEDIGISGRGRDGHC